MRREEEMRAVFTRFEGSGLSLKAFGEREGIPYTTLQYWRRKLHGPTQTKKPLRGMTGVADLAPVRIVADPVPGKARRERFEVWLANGVSLEVPAGFDELELRRLVGVLSAC